MRSKFHWPHSHSRWRHCWPNYHLLSLSPVFVCCFSSFPSDSLVKVRAQVMTRDESTEGWLPLQGGGLANVSIRKRARMPDVGGHEYIIYGQRISDQTVNQAHNLILFWLIPKLADFFLGHSQLRHKSRSSVLQSHADIPPLACGEAAERSHFSNGSWCESFWQGNHQSIWRSFRLWR